MQPFISITLLVTYSFEDSLYKYKTDSGWLRDVLSCLVTGRCFLLFFAPFFLHHSQPHPPPPAWSTEALKYRQIFLPPICAPPPFLASWSSSMRQFHRHLKILFGFLAVFLAHVDGQMMTDRLLQMYRHPVLCNRRLII